MRSDSFRRQRVELAICAGTSLINVILGFFFCLAVIVDDILRFKHKMNWKFAVLLILKLCILSLYPVTVLTLTCHQNMFLTSILFGMEPKPIDGFGAAVTLFILHGYLNSKLYSEPHSPAVEIALLSYEEAASNES